MGTSHGYLGFLEAAQRAPSTVMAATLADVLDLTVEERAALLAEAVPGVGRAHPSKAGRYRQ